MRTVGAVLVLGMLVGAWAMPALPPMPVLPPTPVLPSMRPMCDSPEVEGAAFSALDYINSHHKHGYKYALNRIEEVKVILAPAGGVVYIVELDLLQTTCHAMDPTPLANCNRQNQTRNDS
ncbi:hypothetical protein SKAU_G00049420 [Synaphobranchus kaupii]|uniref:Cystatin fetuin-A-type domain-containing protein n=1 Tax=Synaphobranchus kaupii TaxID=118154 RepID=A0A9Q1G2Q7_SYNKA|nr:hypothetical protein SKAU_G00049420 [Synaphobranchus kaupii]